MKRQTMIALKIFVVMTIVTGVLYPILVTGFAQLAFRHEANGSLIKKDGVVVGSELIGQKFDSIAYFWSRPSAIDYNPLPSGGSNFGPTSAKLKRLVSERRGKFAKANETDSTAIPSEMLTASASGLDPHISPQAALLQVKRIAQARNFNAAQVQKLENLVSQQTEKPQFGVLGESKINVLKLNLELDRMGKR